MALSGTGIKRVGIMLAKPTSLEADGSQGQRSTIFSLTSFKFEMTGKMGKEEI
jgi:hypothetical protein